MKPQLCHADRLDAANVDRYVTGMNWADERRMRFQRDQWRTEVDAQMTADKAAQRLARANPYVVVCPACKEQARSVLTDGAICPRCGFVGNVFRDRSAGYDTAVFEQRGPYGVKLTRLGKHEGRVVRVLTALTNLRTDEATRSVREAPSIVCEGVILSRAEALSAQLASNGAAAEVTVRTRCPDCGKVLRSSVNARIRCPVCGIVMQRGADKETAASKEPRPPQGGTSDASVNPPPRPGETSVRTEDPVSVVSQIRRLGQLRDDGLITTSEFEAKKAELLKRI